MSESAPDQGDAGLSNTCEDKDSSVQCPTCGRDDFATETGMRSHHTQKHGESIATGHSLTKTECDNCGKTIEKRPDKIENQQYTYCSNECQDTHDELHSQIAEQQRNRILVECDNCGSELERTPWRVEQFHLQFCDNECKSEHHKENRNGDWAYNYSRAELVCEWCGSDYEVPTSREDISRFCGLDCRNKWLASRTGDGHPLWEGGRRNYGANWTDQRRAARERDDYTCQSCGATEDGLERELDVHHITPIKAFETPEEANTLDNLVSLCRSCHQGKWEGVPLRPDTR